MTNQERREKIRYGLDIMRSVQKEMEDQNQKNMREYENIVELVAQIEEFCTYYKM